LTAEGGGGPEEPVAREDAQRDSAETTADDVDRELAGADAITQVHRNVDQTVIVINEDRARLILNDLADSLARNRNWGTPLGLSVGFVMSLVTADFKPIAGLSADTVTGIVLVLAVLTIAWTLLAGARALFTTSRKKLVDTTIERMEDPSRLRDPTADV
jgi:hypothetical protein